ncbi:MAG: dodecin family protein [Thiolinea sp.]
MTVAKVSEITSSSKTSFDDAIEQGIARASKTLNNIQSAWVADQNVRVENGKISEYQVRLKVTFVLEG